MTAFGLTNAAAIALDLSSDPVPDSRFDLIVSSMALHHIKEPARLLKRFYDLLLPGGCLGIADLDREDGAFHKDNTGVAHFGFERPQLKRLLEEAGFSKVRDITATTAIRIDKENSRREFSVFLMIAERE
jgi:SAM-dependent methyltransferase